MSSIQDVPFNATAFVDPLGPRQIRLDFAVMPGNIGLALVNGRHAGHLRVSVYYSDGMGQCLGEAWKNVGINLTEPTFQLCRHTGIPFRIMIPFPDQKQMIKIIMYDPRIDRIGSRLINMK